MRTIVAFAFVALLLGCGNTGDGGQEKKSTEAPLTADERTAWEKWRRERKDKPYGMVSYHPAAKEWRTYWLNATGSGIPFKWDALELPTTSAKQRGANDVLATEQAKRPEVKMVVEVDFSSKEDPVTVFWWWDDGSAVKTSEKCPFPELEAGLKAYLLKLQKAASH